MNFEHTKRAVIEDRPIDALLAGYAARTLAAPLNALVEGHLEMKTENRGFVATLEAAFGVFLADVDPVPLTGRDRRLVNIFALRKDGEGGRSRPAPLEAEVGAPVLPSALRRYIGCDLPQLPWQTVASGVEQAAVAEGTFGAASVLRCRPGKRLRRHGHSGLEAILVVRGTLIDEQGRYRAGDIAVADERCVHRPSVESGSELIGFMVSEGKMQTCGLIGRMIDHILGR